MKIVFMGTPDFAVPALKELMAHHDVIAVCTQPDRPAGRGHKLQMSPVKALATHGNVEVLQPEALRIKRNLAFDDLKGIQTNANAKATRKYLASLDADVFVVAAYGLLLPKAVLDMPRRGCINIHASLLPKYRGASPINAVLANGEATTGITIMYMDVGVDTGDMILQRELTIEPDERFQSLHNRMAMLGAECILEALDQIEKGVNQRIPQDEAAASYAPMIKKADAHINWAWPTERIVNLTRAYDPWPGPYTLYNDEPIKIWQVEKADDNQGSQPGTVLASDLIKGIQVQTGDGTAWIQELQAAGGKRMKATAYLRGREVRVGEILI